MGPLVLVRRWLIYQTSLGRNRKRGADFLTGIKRIEEDKEDREGVAKIRIVDGRRTGRWVIKR
jgi:hypothetical protein